MKIYTYIIAVVLATTSISCNKDENEPVSTPTSNPSLELNFRFQVDGHALQFDTLMYENEAHNHYSVHTLMFYLSQLTLIDTGNHETQIKDWIFIDASSAPTLQVSIKDIPKGCYTGFRFNVGIDSAHNIPGGLPPTADNLMMEWPESMGGGYHFLKLEGYFVDTTGTPGFAMHLGTNSCLTTVELPVSFCTGDAAVTKTVFVNVNEWFRSPETFDFNIDGNYIMGNMAAMMKFATNGKDAFTIQ